MRRRSKEAGPNVRSSSYSIVQGRMPCPHCSTVTAVFTLSVPAGYESMQWGEGRSKSDPDRWEKQPFAAVLSYIGYLSDPVAARIFAITPNYRIPTNGAGKQKWTNHCEHCEMPIEEEELREVDGPFGLAPNEAAVCIQLHRICEFLEARVGGETHDIKVLQS